MTFIYRPFKRRCSVASVFAVGYSDSYIDLNWRHTRAIILKVIEMPQFSLSEEVQLEDFTETYESKYGRTQIINVNMDVLTFLKKAATISYSYFITPQDSDQAG